MIVKLLSNSRYNETNATASVIPTPTPSGASNYTVVRWEGAAITSGTPGSSDAIWEFYLFEDGWGELRVGISSLVGGIVGVYTAAGVGTSYTFTQGQSYVFRMSSSAVVVSTGYTRVNGTLTAATAYPTLNSGASPTWTPSGWTSLQSASVDDNFVTVPHAATTVLGTSRTTMYVGSNSYITWGAGSSLYSGLSTTIPAEDKIMMASADRSYQRVAYKTGTTYAASGTDPGSSPVPGKAIFGFGVGASVYSLTNLVSNTGVVATDTTGVGSIRGTLAAAGYGTDKAIFGFGSGASVSSLTNLVSNLGVVATDTTGVGTARYTLAAAGYGTDKAIFGYGFTAGYVSMTNLVSNTGVVATDTTGVGTARGSLAAAGYGSDKAIFGYGATGATTNLVSNTGVVATDTAGVGTRRLALAAAGYGTDKAIFGYGYDSGVNLSITNKVSNTGVVATDTTGVGTVRYELAAAGYGTDKAIFGYGYDFGPGELSMTNLVSNTGVVATDTTGVGTARHSLAAARFGGV